MTCVAHALFCEDIREEISGRFTLVGVLADDLIIKKIPSNIRVCIVCWMDYSEESEPESLVVVIDAFGEVREFPLDQNLLDAAREDAKRCYENGVLAKVGINIKLASLPVNKEGAVSVYFNTDKGRFLAGQAFVTQKVPGG